MRVECAWCGEILSQKGEGTDEVSHSICLKCVDTALRKAGKEAEHQSWLRAFEEVRTTTLLTEE